jgi:hypothetical protein
MDVAKLDLRNIDFDLDGHLNAGGLIHTYAASTTTPLATYTDATGLQANANPIVADSSGNYHLWLTVGSAYKFVFATAEDVTIYTENNVTVATGGTIEGSVFCDVLLTYPGGPPGSSEWLGGERFAHDVDFLANWTSSYGKVPKTLPAASFEVTIKKNNSTVGTATCDTSGVWTFATSGGAQQHFLAGDEIDFYGPSSADTNITDFGLTLAGSLA